jgi:signal transduction histidine kinase
MAVGILIIDEEGRIIFSNPSSEAMFDAAPGGMIGSLFSHPVAEGMRGVRIAAGPAKILEMDVVRVDWKGQPAFLASFQEMTPQKEAERQARHLSLQLMEAQEKERQMMAYLLHEEIGQSLSMLKLTVHHAMHRRDSEVTSLLEPILALTDETLAKVRSLFFALRPAVLDGMSLLDGLLSYFEHYEEKNGIQVNFSHGGIDASLPRRLQLSAYRIIQGALDNVARHARIDRVDVAISFERGFLQIYIEDRGCGFDDSKGTNGSGLGDMKNRAALAGGFLTVESTPGEGTRITCELPVVIEQEEKN